MTNNSFELNCKVLMTRFSKIMEKLISEEYNENDIILELAKLGISCGLLRKQVENSYQQKFLQATYRFIFDDTETVS